MVSLDKRKGNLPPASVLQGFQTEVKDDDAARIDRIIHHYERHIMARINGEYDQKTTWSDRIADHIAAFGGSWGFIITFGLFLVTWMIYNTLVFTHHFDEPPYILLNLVLSFLAAFQAPVIMMSQNRQAARDKQESVIDFAINYKAEEEVADMQRHLHRIEDELTEIKQMLSEMRIHKTES